jgi:hypothetical protein
MELGGSFTRKKPLIWGSFYETGTLPLYDRKMVNALSSPESRTGVVFGLWMPAGSTEVRLGPPLGASGPSALLLSSRFCLYRFMTFMTTDFWEACCTPARSGQQELLSVHPVSAMQECQYGTRVPGYPAPPSNRE